MVVGVTVEGREGPQILLFSKPVGIYRAMALVREKGYIPAVDTDGLARKRQPLHLVV